MSLSKFGSPSNRFTRIGSGLSQLANVVFMSGHPSETISSRAYRRGTLHGSRRWQVYMAVIDRLFSGKMNTAKTVMNCV